MQRWLPCALVLFLCLVAAAGPARAQLASLETPGLQLVYVDPSGKYLVPHVERAFLNSLEFQRRVLGFAPTDDITVLLLDLADGGNAGATAVPHDLVLVQMAPLSHAFETVTANERMTMIMNHELVHVTTMDRPAGRDRLFRKLFVGKVRPTADHPESILYSWLTAPRAAAPRWYIEGAGVFFDTWMAGRPRPRAGRLRRDGLPVDGARRHGVLRPARPDLGRHQDRLQRRGELLPVRHPLHDLARAHVHAREGRAVDHQAGAQPRLLRQRLRAHLRPADGQAWANWVRDEHAFQQQNLEAVRKYPLTPYQDLAPRALGAVSRAYLDTATRHALRRRQRPRHRLAHRRPVARHRQGRAARGHQGTVDVHGDVAHPRPVGRDALLHDRQRRVSRPRPARPEDAPHQGAAQGRTHRRPGVQQRRRRDLGHPSPERHRHARADPEAVRDVGAGPLVAVRHGDVRPRSLARRHAPGRVLRRDRRQAGRPGLRRRGLLEGTAHARGALRLRPERAQPLRLLARRPACVRQRLLHGRVQHLPLRDRDAETGGGHQHRHRLLPAAAAR